MTQGPDEPFPLERQFRRRILPGLALFVLLLAGLMAGAGGWVLEAIYLELAERKAEVIGRAIRNAAPREWEALLAGRLALDGPEAKRLHEHFDDEVTELNLVDLKVYDLERRTLYSPDPAKIGAIESGAALLGLIRDGRATVKRTTRAGGLKLYEFYVPFRDSVGRLRAVFELYEPVEYLNGILVRGMLPAALIPAVLLGGLVLALSQLVKGAQATIDQRTEALREARRRLETFVSASAVAAAGHRSAGDVPSRKMVCTLLYSDVRDFSGFAEANSPERVVRFLNDLMSVQVAAVHAHGGDVDKMIGDALLVRFDGADAPARALAAAKRLQIELREGFLPRSVGVGVYSGEVISGAIGPEERRDFTVIGDAVNVSARLCAAAGAGEIVADTDTLGQGDAEGFGAPEEITVKGRKGALTIRRWRACPGAS
jgi:class 3 adenylate cyclase